jgi:hypothetical protein
LDVDVEETSRILPAATLPLRSALSTQVVLCDALDEKVEGVDAKLVVAEMASGVIMVGLGRRIRNESNEMGVVARGSKVGGNSECRLDGESEAHPLVSLLLVLFLALLLLLGLEDNATVFCRARLAIVQVLDQAEERLRMFCPEPPESHQTFFLGNAHLGLGNSTSAHLSENVRGLDGKRLGFAFSLLLAAFLFPPCVTVLESTLVESGLEHEPRRRVLKLVAILVSLNHVSDLAVEVSNVLLNNNEEQI